MNVYKMKLQVYSVLSMSFFEDKRNYGNNLSDLIVQLER